MHDLKPGALIVKTFQENRARRTQDGRRQSKGGWSSARLSDIENLYQEVGVSSSSVLLSSLPALHRFDHLLVSGWGSGTV